MDLHHCILSLNVFYAELTCSLVNLHFRERDWLQLKWNQKRYWFSMSAQTKLFLDRCFALPAYKKDAFTFCKAFWDLPSRRSGWRWARIRAHNLCKPEHWFADIRGCRWHLHTTGLGVWHKSACVWPDRWLQCPPCKAGQLPASIDWGGAWEGGQRRE